MDTIRAAMPRDASRLAEISIFAKRTAYGPIFQNDSVSFQEMQVLPLALDYRDRPGALEGVYVYDDGIVKGMMHRERPEEGASEPWHLKKLYVDPFFQKQGVGRALMAHFLAEAKAGGATGAYLWVIEKNEAARGFYEEFGFAPDGTDRIEPGTDVRTLVYAKDLK